MNHKSYLVEQNFNLLKNKIILFYGENNGLKKDLKEKIKYGNGKSEILKYFQEDVLKNEENFFNEINNISLFDEEKIYIIEQVNDKILELIKSIEVKIDRQKIYLFADPLDKKSKIRNYFEKSKINDIVACYADNEISIKKIILSKLKNFDGLSAENINLIINSCNLDRAKLNNELSKIITFFENKKLERSKLEKLLDTNLNADFNLLKDEALNGNKTGTNKLLSDTFIDNEKNILYLSIINQRLNKLADASNLTKGTSIEKAIDMMKPPIFWKDKPIFIMQAKKWNINKIKSILDKTYNLEIKIKSDPTINKNILMKKLLVDICVQANI